MSSRVVTINYREVPRQGVSPILIRTTLEDRQDINKAAKILKMSRAKFARMILIQVSRKLIADAAIGE